MKKFLVFIIALCLIWPIFHAQDLDPYIIDPAIISISQDWITSTIEPLNLNQKNVVLNMLFILRHHVGLEISRNYSALTAFYAGEVEYKMHRYEDTKEEIASLKRYIEGLEALLPARQEGLLILQTMEDYIEQLQDPSIDQAIDIVRNSTQKYVEQQAAENEIIFNKNLSEYVQRIPEYLKEIKKWALLYESLIKDELPLSQGDAFLQIQKVGTAHAFSRKIVALMDDTLIHSLHMTHHLAHLTKATMEIFDIYYRELYEHIRTNHPTDESFLSLFDSTYLQLKKNKSTLPLINNFRLLYQTPIYTS